MVIGRPLKIDVFFCFEIMIFWELNWKGMYKENKVERGSFVKILKK